MAGPARVPACAGDHRCDGLRTVSYTHLEENRDRFARILDVNTIRFKKGYIAEVDLIRIRLQVVDFHAQVIEAIQEGESARADLRQLLRLSPASKLELTTEMDYRRVDPDMGRLRSVALDVRPDIKSCLLYTSRCV